ncbi:mevalonate kinase [Symbioplanes lichenis]|uniref:mevalonate kinase n=1 Tax=Symbioplanes lichenis TaxID=1629072 RepID=UPI00273A0E1A|nr:mevalonate kinase [Actinoplanes lichenis]
MPDPHSLSPARTHRTGIGRGAGRAHGKAILLGEHAVVYGAPALVIPLPQLTVTATATRFPGGGHTGRISFTTGEPADSATESVRLPAVDGLHHLVEKFLDRAGPQARSGVDIVVESAVPRGRGLGSSAACARAAALALAGAFGRHLDAGELYDLVQSSERVAHGRASGIDAVATGAVSALVFRSGTVHPVPDARAAARAALVIGDSGTGSSTKEAVEQLARRFAREPARRASFVTAVADLTSAAVRDLGHGDLRAFGGRLTANHRVLREAGISTGRIDTLVEAALAAGALGAKITGGGLGGCMIALVPDLRATGTVVRELRAAGATQLWVAPMGGLAHHGD